MATGHSGPATSLCMAVPHGGVARGNSCLESLSEPSPGTLGILYLLTRSSKIISPGQTRLVLLTLGHWGNSGVDQGLEARGPVPRGPLSPHLQAPPLGALCTRGWAGERRSIWLRSGCSVCRGSLGPPTRSITKGIHYCKRHSSLKSTPNNSQTSRKVMLKMVSSRGGESKLSGCP